MATSLYVEQPTGIGQTQLQNDASDFTFQNDVKIVPKVLCSSCGYFSRRCQCK